jgi:YbgC/YbaW family acyl-CoA thioester hydrolase
MSFVETYRKAVDPSECDILGHMNVSRYFAACSDAMFSLQTTLGLGLSNITGGKRMSFAVVHTEADFRSEVLAGEVIAMRTAVEEIGNKSMLFRHRLYRAEQEVLSFEALFRCVLLDLETRKATPIPDDIREKAERLHAG